MTQEEKNLLILVILLLLLQEQHACAADGFEEGKHPRDKDGKFGSGGGSGGSSSGSGKSFDEYKKEAGGDHSKAARKFYEKELKGKPTDARKELGNKSVNFAGGDDQSKFRQGTNDPVKAEAIQYVRDVINNGKHHGPVDSFKSQYDKGDNYLEYHYFQKETPMKGNNGKPLKLMVDVGKTKKGDWEYIAHNFTHSDNPRYGSKVGHLRAAGFAVEDSKKRAEGFFPAGVNDPHKKKDPSVSAKKIPPSSPRVNGERIAPYADNVKRRAHA